MGPCGSKSKNPEESKNAPINQQTTAL